MFLILSNPQWCLGLLQDKCSEVAPSDVVLRGLSSTKNKFQGLLPLKQIPQPTKHSLPALS